MGLISWLGKKLFQPHALKDSSGKFETIFFENVYKAVYIAGLSYTDEGPFYLVYSSVVRLMILSFVGCELWFLVTMSSSLDGIVDNINVTIIHLIAMYRYWSMIKNKELYKRLSMAMESPHFDISTPRRHAIFESWQKNNVIFFKLLLTLGSCTLAVWYVYPLIDELEYNLVVSVRLPFDYRTPERYPLTYAAVMLVFHYASYFVMVNDLILQAHLLHLICQFAILSDCFENIIRDCSCDSIDASNKQSLYVNKVFIQKYIQRLGSLVEQHKFLLHSTTELKAVLSTPMLWQFAASSMLICFAGYQVTVTVTAGLAKFLMSLLYLGYNMFELFLFCRWCDEIKIQPFQSINSDVVIGEERSCLTLDISSLIMVIPISYHIREAIYTSGWEDVASTPGVRSRLMLVVARASVPLVISAGGLYDLSLSSYSTLVKTSYSALTVLLRVRQE